MTLADVCEEFGIDVVPSDYLGTGWYARTPVVGLVSCFGIGATESDAVCALLKARHRMTIRMEETEDGRGEWTAYTIDKTNGFRSCTREDKLSAIVALAKRLLTEGI